MNLSVIIPVYNYLDLLEKCLFSVYRQAVQPDEIILSDDGSEEDIIGFFQVQKEKTSIPMILVRQEHQQFRAARVRNNGVSVCNSEILAFLDQDIIIPKNYLLSIKNELTIGRFLSGYPVRLSKDQTEKLTFEVIEQNNWNAILTEAQKKKIIKQYRKDYLSYVLCKYLPFVEHGAKMRGGVSAIFRNDFEAVNGYDENYIGWGNEDDDLGKRLHALGRIGFNFVLSQLPLHQYHQPYHNKGERKNSGYSKSRRNEIFPNNYRCQKALNSKRNDLYILK